MESISLENLPIVLHTLEQIELAIGRLQERTKNIRSVDADVVFEVIVKELDPLKKAILYFKKNI